MIPVHFFKPLGRLSKISIDPVCLIFISLSIIFRLPFFFTSIVPEMPLSHDETLALYQGIDVLDGHLPYVYHWDNRPPLGWVLYAILITISFHKLFVFRIIGAVYIGVTAYVIYLTAKKVYQPRTSIFSAGFYIVISSILGHVFTYDYLVGLPFAGLLYYILITETACKRSVKIGLLFATCCFLLTNFIFLLPALILIFILEHYKLLNLSADSIFKNNLAKAVRSSSIDSGIVVCILALFSTILWSIYAIHGYNNILINSLFKAPIVIAGKNLDTLNLSLEITNFYKFFFLEYVYSHQWLIVLLTLGFIITIIIRPLKSVQADWKLFLLIIFSFVSIGLRGQFAHHYLLQVSPAISIAMGRTADLCLKKYTNLGAIIITIGSIYLIMPIITRYTSHNFVFMNDKFYKIAHVLNTTPRKNNYLLSCLDQKILNTLTDLKEADYFLMFNPSRVLKSLGLTNYSIKNAFIEKRPYFIVGTTGSVCFDELGEGFKKNYSIINTIEGVEIYQRKMN